ncbi:bifunctional [glutamate--ammonia ligase]-adenylyl-L-tyrosine phosphorylase/[glutamate--ammonia-ligase] adenylyltransferase [Permianibacter sp. IMCC34836]|uniref:bifunctional [glutamate--ammonia ligase]-adenylyl-L-tyrosine phosphorylase/[glutamate--ammonia-ligase] adenylyltransferase n=1 Tax=Permianibacter fluminis TaxID=2738515 RepID=UPI0015567589|nr:bifunctional [glutamate--ammonia ligase]-adenylyl-L-tyrosine phosphorylase/[glutamate--ammonia-ligase] adenylyltransferase [Permianibacter fluminis]NQD35433.1 bifunctional [glutamate--ammonia ligase]-adenylyl-L-tyrosine phosphorylase/[glutamate--ammonia-ligase] adenylyltransferase [Permianibacter fluminis]
MNPGHFSPSLDDSLLARGERHWQALCAQQEPPFDSMLRTQAVTALALSDFVADQLLRRPLWLHELHDSGVLRSADRVAAIQAAFMTAADTDNEAEFMARLRRLRTSVMLAIAWRDLCGLAEVEETLRHLTALADASVSSALHFLERDFGKRFGTPVYPDSNATGAGQAEPQQMLVLGMGKLGGGELNFSSDIDLIFAYGDDGNGSHETAGPRKLEYVEYFTRLGQRLIHLLSAATEDGFVFRTDMRLRPYGDSGPLVLSLDALEDYYQDQGREWERFAMVKARVLHGDARARARMEALIKPFVFRRYIDYGVLEAIRRLKALINQDQRRKQQSDNIKLGAGGIREVEFIVQAFQLIRGGREASLRGRSLLQTLAALPGLGLLSEAEAGQLRDSYFFLRKTENVLQAQRDEQTQSLPTEPERRNQLAAALGFTDYHAFKAQLDHHRDGVHALFRSVFGEPTPLTEAAPPPSPFRALWLRQLSDEESLGLLQQHGFTDAAGTLAFLHQFRDAGTVKSLSERGRLRLDILMPLLLERCADAVGGDHKAEKVQTNPDETLRRVLQLLRAVCKRTAYLELLAENPATLGQLTRLMADSRFIAEQLSQYPILLDDLLDAKTLYTPPAPESLRAELQLALLRIERTDQEQLLDALREFRHSHMLRIAAATLAGALDVGKVSTHLTALAEAILNEVLELAWEHLVAKHGRPPDTLTDKQFLIVGYGKFGGSELSFSSDLDLVFIYTGDLHSQTDGDKAIGVDQFYSRLAQRIVHMLSTRTGSGVLYEVDTRLRPSGNSGLLVCTLEAYQQYQDGEAWVWEHQALVRARAVAGSAALMRTYAALREQVLRRPRDVALLAAEVGNMRQRMRQVLDKSTATEWDLKHGAGGIVDIEFLVQYWVLAAGAGLGRALQHSHSASLLQALAERDQISEQESAQLRQIYRRYREDVNRLALQDRPARAAADSYPEERATVSAIWQRHLGSNRPAALTTPS